MEKFKNFCLIMLFFIGLALFFSDFIAQGTADAKAFHELEPEDKTFGAFFKGYLNLLVPTILAILTFSISGCLGVSEKTRDVVGWGFILLLAVLSAYIGYQRAQFGLPADATIDEALASRGKLQLGICVFYILLCGGMALKSLVSSPKAQAAH